MSHFGHRHVFSTTILSNTSTVLIKGCDIVNVIVVQGGFTKSMLRDPISVRTTITESVPSNFKILRTHHRVLVSCIYSWRIYSDGSGISYKLCIFISIFIEVLDKDTFCLKKISRLYNFISFYARFVPTKTWFCLTFAKIKMGYWQL